MKPIRGTKDSYFGVQAKEIEDIVALTIDYHKGKHLGISAFDGGRVTLTTPFLVTFTLSCLENVYFSYKEFELTRLFDGLFTVIVMPKKFRYSVAPSCRTRGKNKKHIINMIRSLR